MSGKGAVKAMALGNIAAFDVNGKADVKASGKDAKGGGAAAAAAAGAGADNGNGNGNGRDGKDGGFLILFDSGKEPLRTLPSHFKVLHRKLKNTFRVAHNKDEISRDKLADVRCIVFCAPRQRFEPNELNALKEYLSRGGSILVMGTDGSSDDMKHVNTQLNRLIGDYGITLETDAVVRTVYRKEYFHPKEVSIKDVALVPSVDVWAGKKKAASTSVFDAKDHGQEGLEICYPFGSTLKVVKPATPLLTSGALSFPSNRPLAAFNRIGSRGGAVMVIGSVSVFDDTFIGRDDNAMLATAVFRLLTEPLKVDSVDEDRPEYQERTEIPDIEALAERYRSCLQESEDLPVDFTTLFDHTLFKLDTNLIPEAIKLYTTLGVKHEPLSLIPPQFDVPLPPLQPAVFMPQMRELPPPALDLFDLDAHFATEKLRLAQLTNKCTTDKDLEYYIKEAGEILAITDAVTDHFKAPDEKDAKPYHEMSASQVLEYVFKKLVAYKKIEQDVSLKGAATAAAGQNPNVNPALNLSADSKERMAQNMAQNMMLAGGAGASAAAAAGAGVASPAHGLRNSSAGSSRPGVNRQGSAGANRGGGGGSSNAQNMMDLSVDEKQS